MSAQPIAPAVPTWDELDDHTRARCTLRVLAARHDATDELADLLAMLDEVDLRESTAPYVRPSRRLKRADGRRLRRHPVVDAKPYDHIAFTDLEKQAAYRAYAAWQEGRGDPLDGRQFAAWKAKKRDYDAGKPRRVSRG